MSSERLALSGGVRAYKSASVPLHNGGFSTPQLYSPLPIKNPTLLKNNRQLTSFPLEDLLDKADNLSNRPSKLNKSLLLKFQELTLENLMMDKE